MATAAANGRASKCGRSSRLPRREKTINRPRDPLGIMKEAVLYRSKRSSHRSTTIAVAGHLPL